MDRPASPLGQNRGGARPDCDDRPAQPGYKRGDRLTDLCAWILALADFDDSPERCGERVLEAVQQAWIDELG